MTGDVQSLEGDAPRSFGQQSRRKVVKRRLARAVGADQARGLAARHRKTGAIERVQAAEGDPCFTDRKQYVVHAVAPLRSAIQACTYVGERPVSSFFMKRPSLTMARRRSPWPARTLM